MYLPLQFYLQTKLENIPKRQPIRPDLLQMVQDDDLLYELIRNNTLFTDKFEGKITHFSNEIREHWRTIYEWAAGEKPKHSVFTVKYKNFVRNNFIHMVLANRWGRFKKVYKFDSELELTLCDVEKIKIPLEVLNNIPYKNFYLHFAEDGIFTNNFHGSYVSFIESNNKIGIYFCRVNYNHQTMGGFLELDRDKDDNMFLTRTDVDWKKAHNAKLFNEDICVDWEDFCFFAMNAVLYLCASNAEIVETEPADYPVKLNRCLSNIERESGKEDHLQYFECGYRYGQTIRLIRQAEEKENEEIKTINTNLKKRKSPRPHPVKASWQHYWIGHGDNKQRVLKFKDPYYQGGLSKVATISKVR